MFFAPLAAMFGSSILPGLALTIGSTLMQNAAANSAASARNSALEAERVRQRGMEKQQANLANQSQGEFADFTGDQTGRAADLTQYYQEPIASDANAEAGMVAPEEMSSIVTREMDKQSGAATERTNQNAANLASLRSFGDLMGDRMRSVGRNAAEIDQLSGFRRGSTDVLASELDAAAQRGAGKRLLGDVLGGLGSIATSYGAMASAGNPVVSNFIGGLSGKGASTGAGLGTSLIPRARPTNLLG